MKNAIKYHFCRGKMECNSPPITHPGEDCIDCGAFKHLAGWLAAIVAIEGFGTRGGKCICGHDAPQVKQNEAFTRAPFSGGLGGGNEPAPSTSLCNPHRLLSRSRSLFAPISKMALPRKIIDTPRLSSEAPAVGLTTRQSGGGERPSSHCPTSLFVRDTN